MLPEHAFSRRTLLKSALAAVIASGLSPATLFASQASGRVIPWSNWSGNQRSTPEFRKAVRSVESLLEFLQNAPAPVRAVGAGHSFSGLVPSEGSIISLARLSGLVNADNEAMTATFRAGTPMYKMGPALEEHGLAMINMADIDKQSLAGAIATSTHGTGANLGSVSSQVTGFRIATTSGEEIECHAGKNPELFQAGRTSLGCLGIHTEITLQTEPLYKLKEKVFMMKTEEVLEQIEDLKNSHRHFEMFPLLHSDYALVQTIDYTDEEIRAPEHEEADDSFTLLRDMTDRFPWAKSFIINTGARFFTEDTEKVDLSYRILANEREIRFNEMEYEIPAEAGPACLREILDTVKRENIPVVFPLEYRYVKADDIWLSPFYQRETCSISVHQFHDREYRDYFSRIESIFRKYEGRPHWGKVHTLGASELETLYPKWNDFLQLRKDMDPGNRLANGHIRKLFGLD